MQLRVYQHRNSQYLLIKDSQTIGKSIALMFVVLEKLANQDIKKFIISVLERSIGKSSRTLNYLNTFSMKIGKSIHNII